MSSTTLFAVLAMLAWGVWVLLADVAGVGLATAAVVLLAQ